MLSDEDWQLRAGSAPDIGVSADGSAWIVGSDGVDGGFGIGRWDQGNCTKRRRLLADLHHNSQQRVNRQAVRTDFGCDWSYPTSARAAWPNALVGYDQWHPRFGGDP